MCAVSHAAARLSVETGAIDTRETVTMFKGTPRFGSTPTIFAVIQTEAYYLEQNRYKAWPRASRYDVVAPGYVQTQSAVAGGGFPQLVWFRNHPQVANVRSLGGGTPPRENLRDQRRIDVVVGRGATRYEQCVVFGTGCYLQTGLIPAFAAHHLVHAAPRKTGFASPAEAFAQREILRLLESTGLRKFAWFPDFRG